MICQKCGKNAATNHIHTVLNGIVKDVYLCSSCAKQGGNNAFSNGDLFEMFSHLLKGENIAQKSLKKCELCGSTIEDISKTGRVGCDNCYEVFKEELGPTLIRIHGRTEHIGKRPKQAIKVNDTEPKMTENVEPKDDILELKEQLKNAIMTENYEQAAFIRDEIKKREAK